VGPLLACPRVLVAAGHEGDGMTLAPVTARMVADCLVDGVLPPAELLPGSRLGAGAN
jgi:glycine/D-amino acid oxidase-like deaminating enzyme